MKFYKKVKFFHDKKSIKLGKMIDSYTNFSIDEIESKIRCILKENESVYITELSRKLGRSVSTISAHVRRLESKGKLKTAPVENKRIIYLD